MFVFNYLNNSNFKNINDSASLTVMFCKDAIVSDVFFFQLTFPKKKGTNQRHRGGVLPVNVISNSLTFKIIKGIIRKKKKDSTEKWHLCKRVSPSDVFTKRNCQ
jgi:hypothetical protein